MGAISPQECSMRLIGQAPVRGVTAFALDQPQILKAGQFCAADIKKVVMVHNVDAHRMRDTAAVRSLLYWNSV